MSRLDPGRTAACYVALWAAHDLADHVIQTDEQAAAKADPRRGHWEGAMVGHLAGYAAAQALALGLLRAAGVPLRPSRVLAGLALSIVTHGVLDRRWPVVRLLEATGSARFARPVVRTHVPVDGYGRVSDARGGVPHDAEATGALPLHGPYLADQALHHACVALAAALASSGAAS